MRQLGGRRRRDWHQGEKGRGRHRGVGQQEGETAGTGAGGQGTGRRGRGGRYPPVVKAILARRSVVVRQYVAGRRSRPQGGGPVWTIGLEAMPAAAARVAVAARPLRKSLERVNAICITVAYLTTLGSNSVLACPPKGAARWPDGRDCPSCPHPRTPVVALGRARTSEQANKEGRAPPLKGGRWAKDRTHPDTMVGEAQNMSTARRRR